MSRFVALVAFATAAAVAVLHLLAVAGQTPIALASFMPLFVVTGGCFAAFIAESTDRREVVIGDMRAFTARWPAWARYLLAAVFAYATLTFFWFIYWTGGGTLAFAGTQAYLRRGGTVVRVLDARGVRAFHAWEVRVVTGYLLLALVLSGLYFLLRPRQGQVDPAVPPAP